MGHRGSLPDGLASASLGYRAAKTGVKAGRHEEGHPDWDEDFVPSWETDWTGPQTMYHHNWFAKLFLRQEKYRERGVLIDAPPNFVTVAERIEAECIWRGA